MGGSESRPSSSSSDFDDNSKIMMKAPGRNGETIPRRTFQDNPKDYFRDLRNKDREEGQRSALKTTGVAAAAVAGAALAWGVASMVASTSESEPDPDDNGKIMKAPGRNGEIILRRTFADNPKGYFRDLRNKD